jgi:hypothetical protein
MRKESSIVWTVASELVARKQQGAVRTATERQRALAQCGDAAGAEVWAKVAAAAEIMLTVPGRCRH